MLIPTDVVLFRTAKPCERAVAVTPAAADAILSEGLYSQSRLMNESRAACVEISRDLVWWPYERAGAATCFCRRTTIIAILIDAKPYERAVLLAATS